MTTSRYGDLILYGVNWAPKVTSTMPAGLVPVGTVQTSGTASGMTTQDGYLVQASPGKSPDEVFTGSSSAEWGTLTMALEEPLAPAPTITASPSSPGNGTSPSWSFTGETGATFSCELTRGGSVISGWASCASPTSYSLAGQPDGTYSFNVRATDQAGNTGPAATSNYTFTSGPPGAPTITATPGAVGNSRTPAWSFTLEGSGAATFECELTQASSVVFGWAPCTSPTSFDLTGEPDATYTFAVRAVNGAGTGPASSSNYILDTTPPATPVFTATPGATGAGRDPQWGFTGDSDSTFLCRLPSGSRKVHASSQCTSPWVYDLHGEPDGSYTIEVTAVDAAGNTSTPAEDTYTLDTTPPPTPTIAHGPGASGHDANPWWTFSDKSATTLECKLERDGATVEDWTPCTTPHRYSLTKPGQYRFYVRARDNVGNVSPSANSTYTYTPASSSGGGGGGHTPAQPTAPSSPSSQPAPSQPAPSQPTPPAPSGSGAPSPSPTPANTNVVGAARRPAAGAPAKGAPALIQLGSLRHAQPSAPSHAGVRRAHRQHACAHSAYLRPALDWAPVEVPEVRYARNGDVSIAYQVLGDGPHDLTFVTGFVGHLEVFWEASPVRRFFERLASFSRLILWDKREQGLSDRLGQPPTLEQGMDDLAAVLNAARSQRTALFGISEGGPMSLLYAATYPDRVSQLVLYGTYARLVRSADYPVGTPRDVYERWLEHTAAGWGGPVGLKLWAPSLADDTELVAWWGRLLRSGTSPRAALALMRMYADIDVRPALPAITAPTLVLQRGSDRLIPATHARALAALIPRARYVELEGADHLAFAGDQDALLDEVEEFTTGTRREREPERVLATVLLTDIVSSTERAAAAGDRDWRRILERHDELVRGELERFRGREVKQTGDGFLAAFDGPARAVRCAASIADRVRPLGIEVRAGVHAGECELRNSDISGMAVHIGARVGARAQAGEVLVSSTVKDLVVGSGLRFEDRGLAELKGVPGEWRLYALDPEQS